MHFKQTSRATEPFRPFHAYPSVVTWYTRSNIPAASYRVAADILRELAAHSKSSRADAALGIELKDLAGVDLPSSHAAAASVVSAYEPPDDGTASGTLEACALRQLGGHRGPVWCAAFHPEVPLLATGSSDRTVRLWRLDGHCTRVLRGHEEWVYCCAFNPVGEILCSGTHSVL